MSSNKRTFTHKSSSKQNKVQCRVCKQFIIEQGYTRHLKTAHPGENFKDLRSYGEKKFSWGKNAPNDADLPPEFVAQDEGEREVGGEQLESGGDGSDLPPESVAQSEGGEVGGELLEGGGDDSDLLPEFGAQAEGGDVGGELLEGGGDDSDLPPEFVTQPEGEVGREDDDTSRRFRESSWDRGSNEEERHRRELRRKRELELR